MHIFKDNIQKLTATKIDLVNEKLRYMISHKERELHIPDHIILQSREFRLGVLAALEHILQFIDDLHDEDSEEYKSIESLGIRIAHNG